MDTLGKDACGAALLKPLITFLTASKCAQQSIIPTSNTAKRQPRCCGAVSLIGVFLTACNSDTCGVTAAF